MRKAASCYCAEGWKRLDLISFQHNSHVDETFRHVDIVIFTDFETLQQSL
jgi:hypothetical protein